MNTCCAALMWCTWKMRNDLCFQAKQWRTQKDLLAKLIKTLKNWRALCKAADLQGLDQVMEDLTSRLYSPLRLSWGGQVTTIPLSSQTATQSDLVASDGQVVCTNAGMQAALEEFSEDGNVMADQSPYVAPSVPGVVSLDA